MTVTCCLHSLETFYSGHLRLKHFPRVLCCRSGTECSRLLILSVGSQVVRSIHLFLNTFLNFNNQCIKLMFLCGFGCLGFLNLGSGPAFRGLKEHSSLFCSSGETPQTEAAHRAEHLLELTVLERQEFTVAEWMAAGGDIRNSRHEEERAQEEWCKTETLKPVSGEWCLWQGHTF